jgi:glucokinase
MYLGIQIGGAKLRLGVGTGEQADLTDLQCHEIDPERGPAGVLEQIDRSAPALIHRHRVTRIGIGFPGQVDAKLGRIVGSPSLEGWEQAELSLWCERMLSVPASLGRDCELAALAEATFGAGRDADDCLYVDVGTGVQGCFVRTIAGVRQTSEAELGQLRPGLHAERADTTVASLAGGWGIVAETRARLSGQFARRLPFPRNGRGTSVEQLRFDEEASQEFSSDLLQRCDGEIELLTAKTVAQSAAEGNEIARDVIEHSIALLGWAIAQVITIAQPRRIIIAGGISRIGEHAFFAPLSEQVNRYVFPGLLGSYEIVPAQLDEHAVVCGAAALAARFEQSSGGAR